MEYMNQEYEEHMNVNTKIVKPIKGGFFTWFLWSIYQLDRESIFLQYFHYAHNTFVT